MAGSRDLLIKEIGAALEADRESIHPDSLTHPRIRLTTGTSQMFSFK